MSKSGRYFMQVFDDNRIESFDDSTFISNTPSKNWPFPKAYGYAKQAPPLELLEKTSMSNKEKSEFIQELDPGYL
jgi:hypothetical protein